MSLLRISASAPARDPAGIREAARAVAPALRVLARAAGPWMVPPLTPRLQTPAHLQQLVRALAGRLVVVNPVAAARLPDVVTTTARAALRQALGPARATDAPRDGLRPGGPPMSTLPIGRDPRAVTEERRLRELERGLAPDARAAIAPGAARWGALALYEPQAFPVHFDDVDGQPPEPQPWPLAATLPYRLAIAVGHGEVPPDWAALDAPVAAAAGVSWPPAQAPVAWFVRQLLLPDVLVTGGMDGPTLARWGALTGRAGPKSRDTYWFAESWERFREPGRRVGHVTPHDIARSTKSAAVGPALTAQVERGVSVPPGYALVTCVGVLDVVVVRA